MPDTILNNAMKAIAPTQEAPDFNSKIDDRIAQYEAEQAKATEAKPEQTPAPKEEDEVVDITNKPKEPEPVEESEAETEVEEPKEQEVEEAPAEPKGDTWTIKVNGKEKVVDETKIVEYAQKGMAAEEKFQQAAVMVKDAEQKIEAAQVIYDSLKANPLGTLEQVFGQQNVRQMTEQYLAKIIQFEMLPQEQQANIKAKQEAEYWHSVAEQKRTTIEQTESDSMVKAAEASLDQQMNAQIKAVGLPETNDVRYRVLVKLNNAVDDQSGECSLSVEDAIKGVWEDLVAEHSALLEQLPEDVVKSKFGKTVDRIRKTDLKKVKSKGPTRLERARSTNEKNPSRRTREQIQADYAKKRIDMPLFEE